MRENPIKQIQQVSKLLFVLLLLPIFSSGNLYGQDSSSLASVHLTAEAELNAADSQILLEQFLDKLEQAYRVTFLYQTDVVEGEFVNSQQVNLNQMTGDKLVHILAGLELSYTLLDEQTYVLFEKDKKPVPKIQQQETISGTVTNAQTGELIANVNIVVRGTNTGTSTNAEGHYSLQVPSLQDTLVFSYIGYQSEIVPIRGRTEIDIAMKEKTFTVEELVVTAYGEKEKRENVVGAVTSLNQRQITNLATVASSGNLTTSLAGRIAGMVAYQRSGEPGQNNAEFFVRGVTTFGYDKGPLILIDNVRATVDQLAQLNPNAIENFSVLMDATATALYGSQAANGVLLITTKEGRKAPTQVSIRMTSGLSSPTQVPELADPVRFMKQANQATISRNPLAALPYSRRKISKTKHGANPYLYPAVNWREKLFKDYQLSRSINLSVRGGGSTAQYYVVANFNQQNGLLEVPKINNFNNNIDLKNYSLRSNVNVNLTDLTELAIKINGSFTNYQGPLQGGAAVYNDLMNASPVRFPATFPTDSTHAALNHILYGGSEEGFLNPFANLTKGYKHYSESKINAQFRIKQDLSPLVQGLQAGVIFNIQRYAYNAKQRAYQPFYYKPVSKR